MGRIINASTMTLVGTRDEVQKMMAEMGPAVLNVDHLRVVIVAEPITEERLAAILGGRTKRKPAAV